MTSENRDHLSPSGKLIHRRLSWTVLFSAWAITCFICCFGLCDRIKWCLLGGKLVSVLQWLHWGNSLILFSRVQTKAVAYPSFTWNKYLVVFKSIKNPKQRVFYTVHKCGSHCCDSLQDFQSCIERWSINEEVSYLFFTVVPLIWEMKRSSGHLSRIALWSLMELWFFFLGFEMLRLVLLLKLWRC